MRCVPILLILGILQIRAQPTPRKRTVIAASAAFDGKGRIVRDTRIVIEDSRIVEIAKKSGPIDYDLRGLTVMPGWIDAHTHINWSFGPDGRNTNQGST